MDTALNSTLALTLDAIQTFALIGGGLWAYFRFFREGTHRPRIELDLDCSLLGPQDGKYVAGFILHARNRGNIEYKFDDIRIRVRGIKEDAELAVWEEHEPLLFFSEEAFDTTKIIPASLRYYFVRPGVNERFSFVTTVPAEWRFMLVRASFKYVNDRQLHTTERVFEVQPREAT